MASTQTSQSYRLSCLLFLFLFSFTFPLHALDVQERLMLDLEIVEYWNKRNNERLPVTYSNFLQGGYINMPSARMGETGEIGIGYSSVPPYRSYNLRCQLIDQLEFSGNYRIFTGLIDPAFGHMGFGELSDKGANFKLALFHAEDSNYVLPGLAIGFDDVIGTRAFSSSYLVLTQVFLNYNLEISLGYGRQRLKGFFGGLSWMPFRKSNNEFLRGFSFCLEYDSTPYKDKNIERHPEGRVKRTPWNFGIKYRASDSIDLSASYIRGDAFAFSASTYFNLGNTKGIIPKIEDPLPYKAPINLQPIDVLRPEDVFIQDILFAFRDQGFELMKAYMSQECNETTLRLYVINYVYREEFFVRLRLNALLSSLVPDTIDHVIVVIEAPEMPLQEYHYEMVYLRSYQYQEIGKYELAVLTPLREVTNPNPFTSRLIFNKTKESWSFLILPKTHFLFGSALGKFKYALGISLGLNGFIFDDVFYSIKLGYFAISNLYDIADVDRLNPSQIINVRTDIINYYKQKTITIDEAYVQKISNIGGGWYTSYSFGLLEVEYAGAAAQLLYYPVNSAWAIGMEGAVLKKRTPDSLGFTNKVRKLDGFKPVYLNFLGTQYFLNFYYDWKEICLQFKVSPGKFLANDYGVRYEFCRYYPSGLRLGFWYTHTNAHDEINGQRYYDKGIYFSVPLDMFYTRSSRNQWGYGMSAWLRDVGVKAFTGAELYQIINENRQ